MDDLTGIWPAAVADISANLSQQHRACLSLALPIGMLGSTALLSVPNGYAKDTLEKAIREPITTVLTTLLHKQISLAVTVTSDAVASNGHPAQPSPVDNSAFESAPNASTGSAAGSVNDAVSPKPGDPDPDGEDTVDEEAEALATVTEIWPTYTGRRDL
ncbi:MAG: chromosomal replication initiation protein DnaA, partial [Actinomycetota bacterium]|nr:chromosomal replication initiation protein DnaA [Actinomycetota bacterium]